MIESIYGDVDLYLLEKLSNTHAIGGCERFISRIVKDYMVDYCDEFSYDNLGSIICLKKGAPNGPKIMLSAHMDEVGFMVRHIDDAGFVFLMPIGGWWGHVMPSQQMIISTQSGDQIKGIIGSRAPHGLDQTEKQKVMDPLDLYLDLGVSDREETLSLGIDIGDMVTPATEFFVMNNPNYLCGKAWDDRICVGVLVEVAKRLKDIDTHANIYFVASTQEEVGIRGARTATHMIKPDVAIALDVTTSLDTPLDKGNICLGSGVILSVLDALTIANKELINFMQIIGEEHQLDIHYDFMTDGGTDACNIHKAMEGVPTMTLSIPTRYMHSPTLIVHRKDYVQTIDILTLFCKTFNQDLCL